MSATDFYDNNDNYEYNVNELNQNGSFWFEKEENKNDPEFITAQLEAFMKYFKELKIGMLIPPCAFQNWLHPELKLHYTEQAEGYPTGWIRMK